MIGMDNILHTPLYEGPKLELVRQQDKLTIKWEQTISSGKTTKKRQCKHKDINKTCIIYPVD